ncbi:MAG: GNAT family N-acetyltransferase [Bacteroidales bacterium]|nr:GNAT family N-acetyltransferase [Bacteroidales bacterium]
MNFIVQKAEIKNAIDIALLHKKEIPTGFISSLNLKVVKKLYESIITNEIIFVLENESTIVGFVSCAKNTGILYKKFIKKNLFAVAPYFVLKVFSFSFIKKIFETLTAPKKTKLDNEEIPELLSIVIDSNQQAKGLGKLLLDELENKLVEDKIKKYKVVAGDNLISANKFYNKYGFTLSAQTELHKGAISNIYTKILLNND